MKPTILVVDDEELVRWSLRQRLEAADYQVVEAATGEAAIEAFKNGVDLVLLDYGLPDTNGIDVLITLRNIDPDPMRNFFSVNTLYDASGIAGASGRNTRSPKASDVFYGLDPRELVVVSRTGGRS